MGGLRSIWQNVSAWADLVRLPNLPTVWSNTMVGVVLGIEAIRYWIASEGFHLEQAVPGSGLGALLVGEAVAADWWLALWPWFLPLSLVYVGGMAMHDWCDAPRDALEKPSRPVVRGAMKRTTAAAWAVMGLGLGLILMFGLGLVSGIVGGGLALLIVAYNLTHHLWAGSAALLGLIRGWLVFGVAWAVIGAEGGQAVLATALPIAVVMAVYVTLVSVIARGEDGEGSLSVGKAAWWLVPLSLVSVMWVAPREPVAWLMVGVCGAGLLGWVVMAAKRVAAGKMGPAVGMYLAGIALVDAYTLALLGRPGLSGVALGCFGLALGLQRWRAAGRAT